MGIEPRRNGRRYLYRKERTPSGVRSVYLGPASDPACELLAECAEGRRREAAASRRAHARTFDPIDAALDGLRQSADDLRPLVRAFLVATGHRTHRGQWRRARYLRPVVAAHPPLTFPPDPMAAKKKPAAKNPDGTNLDAGIWGIQTATGPHVVGDRVPRPALASAIRACQTDKPTPADVSRLRDELLTLPAESWGVPLASAEAVRSLAGLVLGSDVPSAATAVVEANAARLASDLAGPEAGPMVRAAAAQAAAAGLCLDAVTARYGRAVAGSYSLDNAAAFERRMTAAQTRYLRALATVAALRRAEGSERERAAKMERDAPAAPLPSLHELLTARASGASGDSIPAPAALDLATG